MRLLHCKYEINHKCSLQKMIKVEEMKEENIDIDTIFLHAEFRSNLDPLEM